MEKKNLEKQLRDFFTNEKEALVTRLSKEKSEVVINAADEWYRTSFARSSLFNQSFGERLDLYKALIKMKMLKFPFDYFEKEENLDKAKVFDIITTFRPMAE